jgi:type IX secretion system PorP/SprF family membrane protein
MILFDCAEVSAQDFEFSQFYANKLLLGPSFAGATQQNRFITDYRNQWPGLPKGFVTYCASFDHNFVNYNSGLGIILLNDEAGTVDLATLELGLMYSYDFKVTELMHIRPGIGFDVLQKSIDYSKAIWIDQVYDNTTGTLFQTPSKNNVLGFDAVTSALLYNPDVWVGLTIDHLLQPNLSLWGESDRSPVKESLYGGVTILRTGRLLKPIDETVSIAGLLTNQGNHTQLDVGLYWAQSPLTFGFWYRGLPPLNSERGDACVLLVGIKVMHFSCGYSYDFTISNLITHSAGAHELSVTWDFFTAKKKKLQAVPCPEF